MENIENNSVQLYNKGKEIIDKLERRSGEMASLDGNEKQKAKEEVLELNGKKDKIKDEIYKAAVEKSGLDYSKDDKNPELLRKKYNEQIADLKKRKQELRLEKIRIEKLNKEKKAQMNQQFEIACEKYKMMLDSGKITQELYESRIENMKLARDMDRVNLGDSLYKIKEETNKIDSELEDINEKVSELNEKEIIYNEYADVYYRLFGEILSDRNKLDKVKGGSSKETVESNNEKTKDSVESVQNKNENNKLNENNKPREESSTVKNVDIPETPNVQEEPKLVVTSKSMFDDLYKKMKKGTITDNELNALAEILENPNNYDKYGITTGLVFNKAKKILKYQGARTAKNIEKFLRENNSFNDEIRFDTSIEKDNILSHDILNSWKEIDNKLTYTDAKFSVEKYIDKIEEYKNAGNVLSLEQESMLTNALNLRKTIASYRKALNATEQVHTDRKSKMQNSILYRMFTEDAKASSNRALPEKTTDRGYVVIDNNSFDLSSMVNNDFTERDVVDNKIPGIMIVKEKDVKEK